MKVYVGMSADLIHHWLYKYYRNSQGDFLEMKKVYVAMSAELPQGSLPFWGTLVW
jgi:hypothetical protein